MNITVDRAVIEHALGALEILRRCSITPNFPDASIAALRTALEQPEQEPVWWMLKTGHGTEFKEKLTDELRALTWKGKPMWVPLYDAPPQRKPLSDDEIQAIWKKTFESGSSPNTFARAIEHAHNIKE